MNIKIHSTKTHKTLFIIRTSFTVQKCYAFELKCSAVTIVYKFARVCAFNVRYKIQQEKCMFAFYVVCCYVFSFCFFRSIVQPLAWMLSSQLNGQFAFNVCLFCYHVPSRSRTKQKSWFILCLCNDHRCWFGLEQYFLRLLRPLVILFLASIMSIN